MRYDEGREAAVIELTEQQVQALEEPESTPPRVVNPRTKETFVLLRVDEYERLKEEHDDSPWTREELQTLAWERVKHENWDEYDDLQATVGCIQYIRLPPRGPRMCLFSELNDLWMPSVLRSLTGRPGSTRDHSFCCM